MNCISNSSDHIIFLIWKLCITTWIFLVLITFPNRNIEDSEILGATRLREGATYENNGQVALTDWTTTSEEPSQRFKLLPNGFVNRIFESIRGTSKNLRYIKLTLGICSILLQDGTRSDARISHELLNNAESIVWKCIWQASFIFPMVKETSLNQP